MESIIIENSTKTVSMSLATKLSLKKMKVECFQRKHVLYRQNIVILKDTRKSRARTGTQVVPQRILMISSENAIFLSSKTYFRWESSRPQVVQGDKKRPLLLSCQTALFGMLALQLSIERD